MCELKKLTFLQSMNVFEGSYQIDILLPIPFIKTHGRMRLNT